MISLNPFANPTEEWPYLLRLIGDEHPAPNDPDDGIFVGATPFVSVAPSDAWKAMRLGWRPVNNSQPNVRISIDEIVMWAVFGGSDPITEITFNDVEFATNDAFDDTTPFENLTKTGGTAHTRTISSGAPLTAGPFTRTLSAGGTDYTYHFTLKFVGNAGFYRTNWANGEGFVMAHEIVGSITFDVEADSGAYDWSSEFWTWGADGAGSVAESFSLTSNAYYSAWEVDAETVIDFAGGGQTLGDPAYDPQVEEGALTTFVADADGNPDPASSDIGGNQIDITFSNTNETYVNEFTGLSVQIYFSNLYAGV